MKHRIWKVAVTGMLMILLTAGAALTGCRFTSEDTSAKDTAKDEEDHAIVVLGPDGVTVVNEIIDPDDTYNVMSSDISNWQEVNALPADAEKLYTFIDYQKVFDHSVLGNSNKFWVVSVQEKLYRSGDTYYLEVGRMADGRSGITVNVNACYQLPDSVGEEYIRLAEDTEQFLSGEDSNMSSGFWEDYEAEFEKEFDIDLEAWTKDMEAWAEDAETWAEDVETWADDVETWADDVETWADDVDRYTERIDEKMDELDDYFDEYDWYWDIVFENNRLDRNIDRFLNWTEGILEVGIGVLIRIIIGILFIPFLILYILGAVGLYRMARKLGYGSPWLAWIPIANLYLMFMLPGGSFRVLAVNKVIEKRENAFWIFVGGAIAKKILQTISFVPGGRLFFFFGDAIDLVWLIFAIFFLYPLYKDLFGLFETEGKAKAFAIWSLILPFLLPIFLLAASSKEPKRPEEPPVLLQETDSGAAAAL